MSTDEILNRRDKATRWLYFSLKHLDLKRIINILCSNIPLENLETLAKFQSRGIEFCDKCNGNGAWKDSLSGQGLICGKCEGKGWYGDPA